MGQTKTADLKEKLSQLKQTVQKTQSDFVKHMTSIDEKLQEARKDIDELEGDLNFAVKKSKPKAEELRSKPQTFNGEYVSWVGVVSTEW